MNRRFQVGHVFKRGKRRKVWVGCYREWVLDGGQLKRMQRRKVIGRCAEMTKSEAEKQLLEILRPVNAGHHASEQSMTFGEFTEKWEKEILVHYRESTKTFYQDTLDRWILPHFKDRKVSEIRTLDVQTFVNKFANYSKSVLKHLRATLSLLFKTAVSWEYIERNPVGGIKLPPGKPVKRAPVLTPEQMAQIIARLEEPYRTMVVIASTTGMRESEVLCLKWEDFDRKAQIIYVRRSLYRGKLNAPKSEQSKREIPYGKAVKQALSSLEASDRKGKDFLFTTIPGNLFTAQQVTKTVFRPLAIKLKLPAFTWRSFRRSAETAFHTQDVPLKVQQQILGHTNPNTTLLYAEPDMAKRREAIKRLDGLLLPNVAKLQRKLQLQQAK